MARTERAVIAAFRAAAQGHVFRWWDEIGEEGRARLLDQLRAVDLEQLAELTEEVGAGRLKPRLEGEIEFPTYVRLPQSPEEETERARARRTGEDLIRAGRVAALTVAGGQGTRLGFEGPKGTYPIGAVSGKTLFEIHAERILATRRRYQAAVPWYIMTSAASDEGTRRFFEEAGYLGLPAEDVLFFRQRMMPALDRAFRLVMAAKDAILMSPNGHGGTLPAMRETGMLADMERRGIEEISYFQVDNPLAPAVDAIFLGFHRTSAAQMSNKAMWKRDADEPLGAFVRVRGRLAVVEYSDLSAEQKGARQEDGTLVYGLGSPAIHALSVKFVGEETGAGFKLPFHVAEKSSPWVNEQGEVVEPEGRNVYKFETFLFDALRDAARSVILEARREEEFSPVKNATGADSPETCRRDMTALYARWLEDAGIAVPRGAGGRPRHAVEISPLYALDAAELAAKVPKDLKVEWPLYLGPEGGE